MSDFYLSFWALAYANTFKHSSQTFRQRSPFVFAVHSLPPWFTVFPHKADKRVNFCRRDVLLQEFAVVVEESRYCILSQHVVADLFLHEAELLGDVFLDRGHKEPKWILLIVHLFSLRVCFALKTHLMRIKDEPINWNNSIKKLS